MPKSDKLQNLMLIVTLILLGVILWRVQVCGCKSSEGFWDQHLHELGTHHPQPYSNSKGGSKCLNCYGISDLDQRLKCLDTCSDASPCLKCQRTCWEQHPKVGGALDGCLDACGKKYNLCY